MKNSTHKNCRNPDCKKLFKVFRTTDKYCSQACYNACVVKTPAKPRNPIPKVSKKRAVDNGKYIVIRIEFLSENKICQIQGPTCTHYATTIEHTRGRRGYADDWARDNKISLLIDKRFFKPSC